MKATLGRAYVFTKEWVFPTWWSRLGWGGSIGTAVAYAVLVVCGVKV